MADSNKLNISNSYKQVRATLPEQVSLVAISKTKPPEDILTLYQLGQRDFGENKVQECIAKMKVLPADIRWHLVGHLQSNKVKLIVPFVYLIHSVDSLKLLLEINQQAEKINRVVKVLLQVYIASEETKFGLDEATCREIMKQYHQHKMGFVEICGLMGMASNTDNISLINDEFNQLRKLYEDINASGLGGADFRYLSMGMSGDYETAIACGSNMVRIGSLLFGNRS